MAKGRKIATNNNSDWENVFYNSVGTYVQCINIELSKEIKLEPLSNHIKIVGGYAFKTVQYQKEGIPIIRISDFNNEQVILKDVIYYKEAKELERYELKEGDIIIALTGGTIAKLAIVQAELGKIYLNQRVGKFQVLHPELFEKEYIYWIARSVQSIIKNLAWGAAIPNVSPKQIENIEFPLPAIEIQQGIILFLNDLKSNSLSDKEYFNSVIENKIIELQNNQFSGKDISSELTHQLSLIKQLRQAFLREAMQGKLVKSTNAKETGQQLLAKIKAEKAQLIAEKKLKKEKELPAISAEEIPFEIPKHWAWCRLGELALYSEAGKSYQAEEISAQENQIGVIKTNAITTGFFFESKNKLLPNQSINIDKIKIKKDDIIFCRASGSKGLAGKSCLVTRTPIAHLILSDKSIRFVFSVDTSKNYIQLYNTSLYSEDYYAKLGTGKSTSMNNITREQFNNLPIPLPPLDEQEQIVAKLEELMKFCEDLDQSIKESQGYNEMLLQQVLREALQGEKEVF